MVSANHPVRLEDMDLPQITSLSIDEAMNPGSNGEVERRTVALDNEIWHIVFDESSIPYSSSGMTDKLNVDTAQLIMDNYLAMAERAYVRYQHNESADWLRRTRIVSYDFDAIIKRWAYSFVGLSGPILMQRLQFFLDDRTTPEKCCLIVCSDSTIIAKEAGA